MFGKGPIFAVAFVRHSDFHLLFVLDLESEDLTIEVRLLATLLVGCGSLDVLTDFDLDERIHLTKEFGISCEFGLHAFHIKLVLGFVLVCKCAKHCILIFNYLESCELPFYINFIP